jgi:asparagine synthetase B (glutamine-hydrolysing)|tara:strand:- start:121 stop:930 length:810 start_codon:yes stop_codon:yes gene_type:complete
MIGTLLQNYIKLNVPTKKVAVLLSGGVDSISVGLAAHNVGRIVHAYSFKLDNKSSSDYDKAEDVAQKMGWEFTGIEVPTNNLVDDWKRLHKLGCKKKTHFECVYPFLYVYPKINEKYVLTGWGADGYFGVSKKATLRYRPESKNSPDTFDDFRNQYFLPHNCAGLAWHNKVIGDKIHVTPYLSSKVKKYFYQFTWEELNRPKQKHHIRNAFPEFDDLKISNHKNLQHNGISDLFETLLNNSEINYNNRKRIQDVCRDWYRSGISEIQGL